MGLRLPSNIGRLSGLTEICEGPFPPRGFAPFEDRAAGNGDLFGLYWPIGREGQEPLVCEALHDEWVLAPVFSDLDTFLRLTDHPDDAEPARWPSLEDDPNSPHACLGAARSASDRGEVEEACLLLRAVIERLPEYTAVLALLSSQCLRLGKHDDACRFAIRAVRSPPSFAYRVDLKKVWHWLSQQRQGPDDLSDDPVWRARARLNAPPSGGAKRNDVYLTLAAAAETYSERGYVVAALSLWQTYGEFISAETVSFRERYGFVERAHRERQSRLEARLPAGSRASIGALKGA